MLALTRKVGYGLIALTYLVRQPREQLSTARSIAERFGLPPALLMNILKELSAAGYVQSVRGVRGGYRLGREPQEVSLADLVEVLEGKLQIARCMRTRGPKGEVPPCPLDGHCPIAGPVGKLRGQLHDLMKGWTLAEIANPGEEPSKPL